MLMLVLKWLDLLLWYKYHGKQCKSEGVVFCTTIIVYLNLRYSTVEYEVLLLMIKNTSRICRLFLCLFFSFLFTKFKWRASNKLKHKHHTAPFSSTRKPQKQTSLFSLTCSFIFILPFHLQSSIITFHSGPVLKSKAPWNYNYPIASFFWGPFYYPFWFRILMRPSQPPPERAATATSP